LKKIMSALLLACISTVLFTGCYVAPKKEPPQIEINPNEEAANLEKVPVTLYFQYKDEFLLSGESRVIEAPVNGRLETAVIKALIEGPSAESKNLNTVLSPSIHVVNVSEEGEYLFITLSADFIKPVLIDDNAKKKRQLAIYSIANTLIELGGYSRIHFRVDKDGTGIGQSLTKSEAGFDGGDSPLDTIGYFSPIVLNPKNTMLEFLKNYANKDWEKVYEYIANRDLSGDEKPSEDELLAGIVSFQYGIEDYEVLDYSVSGDGAAALVLVNYTVKTKDGETSVEKNKPVKLLREDSTWRISYSSFNKAFLF